MSFGEISVICLVGLAFFKVDDVVRAKKMVSGAVKSWSEYTDRILHPPLTSEDEEDRGKAEMMNFYLARIIERKGEYEGEYNIAQLRETYRRIVLSEAKENEEEQDKSKEVSC